MNQKSNIIKDIFNLQIFSALFFLINKTFLKTRSTWISLIVVTLICCIPQYIIFIVHDMLHTGDNIKLSIMTYFISFQLMVMIMFGFVSTFTSINESTISERIGSTGINKFVFVFDYWFIFGIIGTIGLLFLNVFWMLLVSFYLSAPLHIFNNFFKLILFELLFVWMTTTFSLFISSLRFNSRVKTMYLVLIVITFFYFNYSGIGLLSIFDEIGLPLWLNILKWIYLIFINILILPVSLIWFTSLDSNKFDQLWYIIYPIYMIFSMVFLFWASNKIFKY